MISLNKVCIPIGEEDLTKRLLYCIRMLYLHEVMTDYEYKVIKARYSKQLDKAILEESKNESR